MQRQTWGAAASVCRCVRHACARTCAHVSVPACMCAHRMCMGVTVCTHTAQAREGQLPISEQRAGHPECAAVEVPGWAGLAGTHAEGDAEARAQRRHSSAREPWALGRALGALPGTATRGPFPPGLPAQPGPQQGLTPHPQTARIRGVQGRGVTKLKGKEIIFNPLGRC